MEIAKQKILVTGGKGFLGRYVVKNLIRNGASEKNIIVPRSKEFDLRKSSDCKKIVQNIDIVIHLAGNVGGIGKNLRFPGTLFYENAIMGIQLIHESMLAGVKKIVIIGTVCSYPKYTPVPFSEDSLWIGYPEETNAPYGLAKKILLVQSQAYRAEFGLNSIYLLPVNLYGPGDNFDQQSSHVIPALIRNMFEAKKNNQQWVEAWGDGSPTREFLYVDDAARAIVLATQKYNKPEPVNLGSGKEISIKELAILIAKLMNFKGKIMWNTTKPNGQPRRLLDTSRAYSEFRFESKVSLQTGLKHTIQWFYKQNSK